MGTKHAYLSIGISGELAAEVDLEVIPVKRLHGNNVGIPKAQ
jgi:hypothetical protein